MHMTERRCCSPPAASPIAQPARLTARRLSPLCKSSKSHQLREARSTRCRAVAEVETEVEAAAQGKDDFEVKDLNSKDFNAVFDDLLERTKTRFDVSDKVKGVVERCVILSRTKHFTSAGCIADSLQDIYKVRMYSRRPQALMITGDLSKNSLAGDASRVTE